MQRSAVIRLLTPSVAGVMLLGSAIDAVAIDSYDGMNLTIPAVTIGGATHTGMVATVAAIVSGPTGSAPVGSVDSYDPSTNRLTVPAVTYASRTWYNLIVNVETLKSDRSVSGADVYSSGNLTVPAVQVGTRVYTNVVLAVTPGDVVSIGGNMPTAALDQYEPALGELFIPAVQVGSTVYTNVTITATPADVVSIGGVGGSVCPSVAAATTLSLSTGSPFHSFVVQTPTNAGNVSYSSYGFDFSLQGATASAATVSVSDGLNPAVSIADVGPVCGLGAINEFPAKSQFASYGTLMLQQGHGYFVEAPNGSYARLFVSKVYSNSGVDLQLEYPSVICPRSGVSIQYDGATQTYNGVSIQGVVTNAATIDDNGTIGTSRASAPVFGCNAIATVQAWGGGGGGGGNYDFIGGAGGGGGGGGGYGAQSIVLTPGQYYLATAGAGGTGGIGMDGANGQSSQFATFSASDSSPVGTALFVSTGGQAGKAPVSHTASGVGGVGGTSSAGGTSLPGQAGTNGITVAASPCSPPATFGIGPGGAGGNAGGSGGKGGAGGCTPGSPTAPGGGGAGDSENSGSTSGAHGRVVITY